MSFWKSTRTNTGHKAGPAAGRWQPREDAKTAANHLRRAEETNSYFDELQKEALDEVERERAT